ncbi:MAG: hypothetical protein DWQ07_09505 [Chloroflexi bacterium]|nr:MAG: hypothetical protein DWQ07_09505 [Chloroflexota bacterium]MBL1193051.1 hypothetical protein [Chloroflexota bacterium]NOH10344.1 hypothetical protein [Chloroflexota bacterium]
MVAEKGKAQPGLMPDKTDNSPVQWIHTGGFRDYGAPQAVCELCGHTRLRYHFLIANRETGEALWVGSKCIEQFEVAVRNAQGQLVEDPARKGQALREVMRETLTERVLVPIDTLFEQADRQLQSKLRWITGKFTRRGGFSPKDLVTLFRLLDAHNIEYEPGIYPVTLRSKKDRVELVNLSRTASSMIWDCLSTAQQEKNRQLFGDHRP